MSPIIYIEMSSLRRIAFVWANYFCSLFFETNVLVMADRHESGNVWIDLFLDLLQFYARVIILHQGYIKWGTRCDLKKCLRAIIEYLGQHSKSELLCDLMRRHNTNTKASILVIESWNYKSNIISKNILS